MRIYNEYLTGEERMLAIESARLENEYNKLSILFEMTELQLAQMERDAELKVFEESGTYDDLAYLYQEADGEVVEKRQNILQRIISAIGKFFTSIANGVKRILGMEVKEVTVSKEVVEKSSAIEKAWMEMQNGVAKLRSGDFAGALDILKTVAIPAAIGAGAIKGGKELIKMKKEDADKIATRMDKIKETIENVWSSVTGKIPGLKNTKDQSDAEKSLNPIQKLLRTIKTVIDSIIVAIRGESDNEEVPAGDGNNGGPGLRLKTDEADGNQGRPGLRLKGQQPKDGGEQGKSGLSFTGPQPKDGGEQGKSGLSFTGPQPKKDEDQKGPSRSRGELHLKQEEPPRRETNLKLRTDDGNNSSGLKLRPEGSTQSNIKLRQDEQDSSSRRKVLPNGLEDHGNFISKHVGKKFYAISKSNGTIYVRDTPGSQWKKAKGIMIPGEIKKIAGNVKNGKYQESALYDLADIYDVVVEETNDHIVITAVVEDYIPITESIFGYDLSDEVIFEYGNDAFDMELEELIGDFATI